MLDEEGVVLVGVVEDLSADFGSFDDFGGRGGSGEFREFAVHIELVLGFDIQGQIYLKVIFIVSDADGEELHLRLGRRLTVSIGQEVSAGTINADLRGVGLRT